MADDVVLEGGACNVLYYDLAVGGVTGGTFDVDVALWDGDPCEAASTIIPGTARQIPGVPSNGTLQLVQITLAAPAAVPGTVWIAATFSTAGGGWVFAEQAEIGLTGDFWSEDNLTQGCGLFQVAPGTSLYGGFWANVYCELPAPPIGACCNGVSCNEVTQAECVSGVWQGDFTTCSPDPCLPGACCGGATLTTCSDTTESGCVGGGGLFHAGASCSQSPCLPTYSVFANNFDTGGARGTIAAGTMWGDDLDLGATAPCELLAFDVEVASEVNATTFDAHAVLWTNDDRGTPLDSMDDIPLTPMTGTAVNFAGIPGSGVRQRLLAGPFSGIQLDRKVWLVLSTTSALSGPVLAGMAEVGSSVDGFAIFDDPAQPGLWAGGFSFGGFDPAGCPSGPSCRPAGSFKINVWCSGERPPGACCDALSGTCIDNVPPGQCPGRWMPGVTCDTHPFDPPCGTSACCVATPVAGCMDTVPSFCASLGGAVAVGSLCNDLGFSCPRDVCLTATGDCSVAHVGVGCDDPFCCESVCTTDSFCCDATNIDAWWDTSCAGLSQTCPASSPCPSGTINFVDPPDGTVDARQPHPPFDAANRQGIKTILVEAPPGANNLLCWTPSETVVDNSVNMITRVVDVGGGRFAVSLLRSISSGGVTTITYTDDAGVAQSASFTSHPGNVDGDTLANGTDVQGLFTCLEGTSTCELWECDADHSGRCTPSDALRVIDLLNGAGDFDPWMNTPLP